MSIEARRRVPAQPAPIARVKFYPCQLPDGSTHVIGPGSQIAASFEDPDLTVRWQQAKHLADDLNRREVHRAAERKVRRRWVLVFLALAPLIIDGALGGMLSREVVQWIMD